jgi:hypothetical protein
MASMKIKGEINHFINNDSGAKQINFIPSPYIFWSKGYFTIGLIFFIWDFQIQFDKDPEE